MIISHSFIISLLNNFIRILIVKKKLLLILFLVLNNYLLFSESIDSNILFQKMVPFPLGWENKSDIESTMQKIDLDISGKIINSGDSIVIKSPISGNFKVADDCYIIENMDYRIIYPRDDFTCNGEEWNKSKEILHNEILFKINKKSQIVFFCRKVNGDFPYARFEKSSLSIKIEDFTKIFSISNGRTYLNEQNIILDKIYMDFSVSSEYEINYLGLDSLLFGNGKKVEVGDELGTTNKDNANNGWFSMQIIKMPFGELEPKIIYIEKKMKCDK